MSFPVKLLMTWNIRPGREEPYFEFITQEFPTVFTKRGFQITDAWYTTYGEWPQVTMGFAAEDLESVRTFLTSEVWLKLRQRLFSYISDYRQKIVPLRGGFQL